MAAIDKLKALGRKYTHQDANKCFYGSRTELKRKSKNAIGYFFIENDEGGIVFMRFIWRRHERLDYQQWINYLTSKNVKNFKGEKIDGGLIFFNNYMMDWISYKNIHDQKSYRCVNFLGWAILPNE